METRSKVQGTFANNCNLKGYKEAHTKMNLQKAKTKLKKKITGDLYIFKKKGEMEASSVMTIALSGASN